jgi:hypothetical protein
MREIGIQNRRNKRITRNRILSYDDPQVSLSPYPRFTYRMWDLHYGYPATSHLIRLLPEISLVQNYRPAAALRLCLSF